MKENSFAYMKIYKKIRSGITDGIYEYGSKLPSKRVLAEETGTSVITASHAYEILCDEGYVESRQRSGYYVIYNPRDNFPVSDAKPIVPVPVHHDLGEFPFNTFAKTARKVLTEQGETLFEKSENIGIPRLRNAISRYLARSRGIIASSENIIIGAGSEYLYGLIIEILGRNKTYAIEDPSYEKIERVYLANGVGCEKLKMSGDGIMSSELSSSSADALHITPFNSFPSGITASPSKRLEYLLWAEENDAIIIEDDFDSEFSHLTKTQDTVFALEAEKNGGNNRVIYMNTFSKTVAPSIRMGYMVLPPPLMEKFRQNASFYSSTVSVFEQHIIAEFLESGDFERHINKIRRKRRKNNKNNW